MYLFALFNSDDSSDREWLKAMLGLNKKTPVPIDTTPSLPKLSTSTGAYNNEDSKPTSGRRGEATERQKETLSYMEKFSDKMKLIREVCKKENFK